jgi:uncharacterized membrane protein YuzA (DUF378 family)
VFSTEFLLVAGIVGVAIGVCGTICIQFFLNKNKKGKANADAESAA